MNKEPFNYKKFRRSFVYAWRGFKTLIATEQNARVHLISAILVACFSIYFKINRLELAIIFFAVTLVFTIEIMNTAIEKFLDVIHPSNHYQIRYIKDAMAGAVLISAFIALVVGILIFYPYIKNIFN